MKSKYIITAIFFLHSLIPIKAQILIGKDKTPEEFCIVEVESKTGGVRLPRISGTDKTTMNPLLTGNEKSKGLVIYNSSDKTIEFWDGSKWVALTSMLTGKNGLTDLNAKELWLGGDLIQDNTIIDMADNEFKFQHNTGANFIINDTMIVVNNKIVDIRADKQFSVNDTVIKIRDKYLDIRPALLSINNTFKMNDTERTKINGHFQYKDGTENQGYLLTADNNGNAYWGALRPLGTIISSRILSNIDFSASSSGTENSKQVSSSYIELPPGQWLIFAKYNSRMIGSTTGMYHWIVLMEKKLTDTGYSAVARAGANPEKKTLDYSYVTPFLIHYVNIKDTRRYVINAVTSNRTATQSTTISMSWIGNPYFYALRIDIPTD